jgi:hypothetical protein
VPKPEKKAKFGAEPLPEKKAHFQDPCFADGHPLAWRFSAVDKAGPFAWAIVPNEKFREVLDRFHEFEGMNWAEIIAAGSHPIEVHRLEKPARDRLMEIERDDLDELMSFRFGGANRVWCDQKGHLMRVLWWDERHQVYIVPKDKRDRKKANRRKRR